jgi:hypothetical protein
LQDETFQADADSTSGLHFPEPWVRAEETPAQVLPLEEFRFFAVLGTWNEEDIVEACVRNAMTQGCERVLLVDNASDDATVTRALAAGAELACRYSTDDYDEYVRLDHMQAAVDSLSAGSGTEHIWWLWLDADEFPQGRRDLTLREQLASLDQRFRVVGARVLNHYPSGSPQYVVGDNPLQYQPLAEEIVYPHCDLGHRKHPLQRWDATGSRITCGGGFHHASAAEQLIEPVEAVIIHHFPFRDEALTRARLKKLCEVSQEGWTPRAPPINDHHHIWARYQSMDAVYRQNWAEVIDFLTGAKGVHPRPWTEVAEPGHLVDELERSVTRLRRDLTDREYQVRVLSGELTRARNEIQESEQSVTFQVLRRLSDGFYRLVGRESLVARAVQRSLRLIGRVLLRSSES